MTVIDDTVETIKDAKSRCGYEKCKNHRRNDDDDDDGDDGGGGAKKHSRELKRCSRCKSRWYCSINCQKADFPSHKKECRRIAAASSNVRAAASSNLIASDEIFGNKGSINKMWMNQQQQQYQVEEREGKGRCLVATRTIHPKERINPPSNAYSSPDNDYWDPMVPPVLSENRRDICCAICFRDLSLLVDSDQHHQHHRSTPQTQNPLYQLKFCSQQCSDKAMELGVFEEEAAISRFYEHASSNRMVMPPRIFSTAILVFRIVLRLQHDRTSRQQIDELQSEPRKNFQNDDTDNKMDEVYHTRAVIATVMKMLQFHSSRPTKDETTKRISPPSIDFLTEILWKIKLNGFSICDGESVTYGVGLFSTPASFINHACGGGCGSSSTATASRTNAIQTFYFRQGLMPCLCLTAFADEAIQPGDEICISYTDTMRPSHLRQAQLKRTYYFQCRCDACVNHLENEDGWRMGLMCNKCQNTSVGSRVRTASTAATEINNATTHPSSFRCPNCNNADFFKALKLINDFEDGHKKQQGDQRFAATTTTKSNSHPRSRLHQTYTNLKSVCSNNSWYVQESGEELLQSMLDGFPFCDEGDEEKQQRIGFEALALIEELVSSEPHGSGLARQHGNGPVGDRIKSSRSTSSFLRHYQLLYKGAKLRLFLIPDPRRSIQELQDIMKALSPYYPPDHEFMNGLKECLSNAMR